MKYKRLALVLFIVFLTACNWSVNAFAMNTGFSTNEMSAKDKQTFQSNFNLSLIKDEPQKGGITCFDVSSSGLIAIGTKTSENQFICVYDTFGKFQYGYAFNCDQSFGVQWDDKNLIIYLVRSDVAALFDSKGALIELKTIEDTVDNNSYWNNCIFAKERTLNDSKYAIKNNMGLLNLFSSSYSQLVKTDSDNTETIIYDVSAAQTAKTVFIVLAVILFAALVISVIIWQTFKAKNGRTTV